jgi:FKBP-type peptidyl-prolyl cis-trans isomerase FkpA
MKFEKIILLIACLVLSIVACKKDDDGEEAIVVEIRDRAEQQIVDKDSLVKYLNNHYYNSDEFGVSNTDPSITDLTITKLLDGETVPTGHSLLINDVETISVVFAETDYEYYVLRLNQGRGLESPTFADNVIVTYEGFTLDDAVFDSAVTPTEFDLTGVVSGWRKVFPLFNTAEGVPTIKDDGTVNYMNHGVGVMFLPSGLAYFSSAPSSGIPSYSSLIFKFELFDMTQNDHDNDGVPSYLEDLNGDGEFLVNGLDLTDDTDDDTDGDGTPNIGDNDDDGDGVPTIREDIDKDGDPTNDIGKNGIPNYLDPEETEVN